MKLQTNDLKMSEEEPDKSVKVSSRSTQFAVRTWQARLEQSKFVEAEKKPIEVYTKQEFSQLLKHFYFTSSSKSSSK